MNNTCATPGCSARRSGSARHCLIHIRPGPEILAAVVAAVKADPSAEYTAIADRCYISRTTVRRALRVLEQDGVITPLMRQVVREL